MLGKEANKLLEQKNLWPHQFTKTPETKEGPFGPAFKIVCVHCNYFYWDVYPQPTTPCPARTDKKELKRLIG